jgi:hypothetical protein
MTGTATAALDNLEARRAAAIALANEIEAKLDQHPAPALRGRLHSVVNLIDHIDGLIARRKAST